MNNKIRNQSNSIILLHVRSICNLAFCLKTRNQRARKQFGIHNSQNRINFTSFWVLFGVQSAFPAGIRGSGRFSAVHGNLGL